MSDSSWIDNVIKEHKKSKNNITYNFDVALDEFTSNTNKILKYQVNDNKDLNINKNNNEKKPNQFEPNSNLIFSENDLKISGLNNKIENDNISDNNILNDESEKKRMFNYENINNKYKEPSLKDEQNINLNINIQNSEQKQINRDDFNQNLSQINLNKMNNIDNTYSYKQNSNSSLLNYKLNSIQNAKGVLQQNLILDNLNPVTNGNINNNINNINNNPSPFTERINNENIYSHNEVNKLKMEINNLSQENNLLKAKIIDIEQIITKYEEKNKEYNNYFNSCYIFFDNVNRIGLNQLNIDISQYNNKLMNINEFKNNLNKIENYIVFLQKEINDAQENEFINNKNNNYENNGEKQPIIDNNNNRYNENINDQNYEGAANLENNNSYYNNNENNRNSESDIFLSKKISYNNNNCSNIANFDEDNYTDNDYLNYENYNENNNDNDNDNDNDNNNRINNEYNNEQNYNNQNNDNDNESNLLVEDLNQENNNNNNFNNMNNYGNNNQNQKYSQNPYDIYKTLEQRVNMLEKELILQKQNNILQSNNKNNKINQNKNNDEEKMNNIYFYHQKKGHKKGLGVGNKRPKSRTKSNIKINYNYMVDNCNGIVVPPIKKKGVNKKGLKKKKKKNINNKMNNNNVSKNEPKSNENNYSKMNNNNKYVNSNANYNNNIIYNFNSKGASKLNKKNTQKIKRSATPLNTENKNMY